MRITCPACRAENDTQAEICDSCGTPLRGFAQLSIYPAQLFNIGLSAAREGQMTRARDLFAAVVHWCPTDREARNALAMACLALGDKAEARRHWETVLDRFPTDALATQGIASLEGEIEPGDEAFSITFEKIQAQLKEIQEKQEKHSLQLTEVLAQTQPKGENRFEENIRDIQEVVDTRLRGIENRLNKRLLIGGIAAGLIIVLSIFALREVITLNNQIKHVQGTLQVIGEDRNKQLSELTGHLKALTERFQGKEEPNIFPRVREALSRDDRLNWLNINFQQENGGNIRLKGEVYTNYLKNLVERTVGNIEGVNLVDSRELKIISSYKVQHRDTFWKIAEKVYGDGGQWEKIYKANQDKISNPSAIRENTIVFIPNQCRQRKVQNPDATDELQ